MRPLASGSTSIWMRLVGSLMTKSPVSLAAQTRYADGEHQIDSLIELLDLRHAALPLQAAEETIG